MTWGAEQALKAMIECQVESLRFLASPVREPARVEPWSAVSLLAITTVPNSVINPGCSKIERPDTLGTRLRRRSE
jgi:hypothetical protein